MKKPKDYLTAETRKALKGSSVILKVINEDEPIKYSKAQYASIYKGYDMLENLFTVRTYIQKKYNIDSYLFEILLKLMGMKVWTLKDFTSMPKPFNYGKLQNLLDTGLVNLVMDDPNKAENRIYCLNMKGRNIIVSFYEYLSGEKRIPEESKFNPMANKEKQTPYDKKKMDIIRQMNNLPLSEHKKTLFK